MTVRENCGGHQRAVVTVAEGEMHPGVLESRLVRAGGEAAWESQVCANNVSVTRGQGWRGEPRVALLEHGFGQVGIDKFAFAWLRDGYRGQRCAHAAGVNRCFSFLWWEREGLESLDHIGDASLVVTQGCISDNLSLPFRWDGHAS